MLRELLVKTVKPLVSDDTWQRFRQVDPASDDRDRERARHHAKLEADAANAALAQAPSLTELARRYGTDKWGTHRYTPHYEQHLGHLRQQTFTLLEIGIGGYAREKTGGASLRMWRDYFPNAQIVGLDIEDKSFVDGPRIKTYRGSQTDGPLLRTIMTENDHPLVVIDDGSHQNAHVIATFAELFPLLPDGGTYVIEDTQTSYQQRYGGSLEPDAPTSINFVKTLLDAINWEEFTPSDVSPSYVQEHIVGLHIYHNLVIIDKGRNEEGSHHRKPSKPA